MRRGLDSISAVLFAAIGIVAFLAFYYFVTSIYGVSRGVAGSDVDTALHTGSVSIVYAVGDYNSVSGRSTICVGVHAINSLISPDGATLVVKNIATSAVLYVISSPIYDCNVISDSVCTFCGDAPISPGRYLVEFSCTHCIRTSGFLEVH